MCRSAQLPRGLCHFFLDKKVTKRSSQQKGFFAAQAFTPQIRQNLGCKILRYFVRSEPQLRKFRYALQPHYPPSFFLISPEAALLTGNIKRAFLLSKSRNKAGKGLTEKRARVHGGNAGLAFALREGAKKA